MFDPAVGVTYNKLMKSKVLLAMLVVLIVLAGIGIMCGTIFVVREIEVVDANAAVSVLTDAEKEAIMNKTELKGKNILFNINQEKIKASIKTCDPMYKVHSIKTQFPSKVIITISRRVPIYFDTQNGKYYDAEMYIVKETGTQAADCVNITGANLQLKDGLDYGDLAAGATAADNRKIAQLKIVAGYFADQLSGLKISYNDNASHVGGRLICLHLQIADDVTFEIKTKADDDFAHLLAFTNTTYQNDAKRAPGNYKAMYHESGRCTVRYTNKENGEDKTYVEK